MDSNENTECSRSNKCSCNSNEPDQNKRKWLIATSVAGGVGVTALVIPLVTTFSPSEKAKAAGAPVEMDIGGMQPGELRTTEWRGKPVWVVRRTQEMISALSQHDAQLADPNSERKPSEFTPEYARNPHRSIKPEYLVAVGICTHLGCSPVGRFQTGANQSLPNDWPGGFFCPCHGSTFDLAGRVFKNKPAPDNLEVPPHMYLSDTKILIGKDKNS
jgi:ubiquinol-cytochrome c reductase iron-sulfur subunit